jgi:hypothetical protein
VVAVALERYSVADTEAPSSTLGLLADWLDPIAGPDLLGIAAAAGRQALVEWIGVSVRQKITLPCRQMTSNRRRADRTTNLMRACYRGASSSIHAVR